MILFPHKSVLSSERHGKGKGRMLMAGVYQSSANSNIIFVPIYFAWSALGQTNLECFQAHCLAADLNRYLCR